MKSTDLATRNLISLDQCFLSRLAIKRKRDEDFEHLLHALLGAVRSKDAVCPAHALETKYESIKLNDAGEAGKVLRLQNSLSLGYAFHPFWDFAAWKMLQMVRPSFTFQRCKYAPIKWERGISLEWKRCQLNAMDQQRQETISRMPYPPSDYKKGTPFEETLAAIEQEREESMRVVLNDLSRGTEVRLQVDWMAGVRKSLRRERVTPQECAALLATVDDGRWRQIDLLRVNSILFAKIEQGMPEGGRVWRLSDHADIARLCVSLLYADVATCDKGMRDVIKQASLETWCPARVFAITEPRTLAGQVHSLT
jgi:hypothetical protein